MRLSFLAVCLSALPQVALAAPPPQPPDPAQLAAAVAIWRDHPLPDDALSVHARSVVGDVATNMLRTAGTRPGSKEWRQKRLALDAYFWANISSRIAAKEPHFLECLAMPYAWMDESELQELRSFLATDTGKLFWKNSRLTERDTFECARSVLQGDISDIARGGWKLIGKKPPPPSPDIP